jgi:hypothetical protein
MPLLILQLCRVPMRLIVAGPNPVVPVLEPLVPPVISARAGRTDAATNLTWAGRAPRLICGSARP